MRLTGSAVPELLATLLLAGASLAVPIGAVARDACPTVMPASALPDPGAAVEIYSGEPLAAALDRLAALRSTIDDRSQVIRIRQIPDQLPTDVSVAWVWQFGYLVDPEHPGDLIEQIAPRYEAILCVGTRVPDAIGGSAAAAVESLEARGLVVAPGGDGDGRVAGLKPGPGELVEFGTTIWVISEPAAPVTSPPSVESPPTDKPQPGPTTPTAATGPLPPPPVESHSTDQPQPGPTTPTPATGPLPPPPNQTATGADEGTSLWPWIILITIPAAVGALVVARRMTRRGRGPDHEPDVTTRVHDDAPSTGVTELPGVGASHTVRVQAHRQDPEITITPSRDPADPFPDDPHGTVRR